MPLAEMQEFSLKAFEIFSPLLAGKGFALTKTEVEEYFTHISFRKGNQYVTIKADSFPTSYPWSFNVVLGEGDSETFLESDWNSIGLWQLKQSIDPASKETDYKLTYDGKPIPENILAAKDDLENFGKSFLEGDLTIFLKARKAINEKREPYRVSYVDDNGNRQVAKDADSTEMKKKYS